MSPAQPPLPSRAPETDRRELIVAAAERAFVRHGFHAATMQQVADEAGMSAGNLYRYFPSKEALVEGICARDQRERAAAFEILAGRGDLLATLAAMLREHVLDKPREKAAMMVEIRAEAARNPRIAAMTRAIDADVHGAGSPSSSRRPRPTARPPLSLDCRIRRARRLHPVSRPVQATRARAGFRQRGRGGDDDGRPQGAVRRRDRALRRSRGAA